MAPVLVVVAAAVAGVLGACVPAVVARLPEPDPDPDPGPDPEAGPPKEAYADLAALPWLRPVAVVLSAVLAGALAWRLGPDPALVGWVPLVPLGVALAVVDLRTHLLPKRLVVPATVALVVVGVAGGLALGETGVVVRALLGLAAAYAVFFVLWFAWPRGLGYGDVRLVALLGFALAWLGWAELVVGVYGAFVVMALGSLVALAVTRDRTLLRRALAFGPALLASAWAAPFTTPAVLTLLT